MKVIAATGNAHKLKEFREIFPEWEIVSEKQAGFSGDVEETGTTFEENALIKARAVCKATGFATLADDSGICVDALGGAPGVYSARYSLDWPEVEGESTDRRNNRKLLASLEGVPAEKRTARFRCCMAMVYPSTWKDGPADLVVSGAWEGRIAFAPSGSNGFGYDPLFIDPASGRTGAELSREEKMARSHRGKALERLLEELEKRGA